MTDFEELRKDFVMLVKMKIRLKDLLGFISYKFTFDLVYVLIISKVYGYTGFGCDFNILKYLLLTIVFFLLTIPSSRLYYSDKGGSFAMLFFTFLYFIPGLSYLSFNNINLGYIGFYLLYWSLLLFWFIFLPDLKLQKIRKKESKVLFYLLIMFFAITVIYLSGRFVNFRLHLDIMNVYGIRAEEREMAIPILFRYLIPLISKVIPVVILYYLIERKYYHVFCFVFLQFLLFSIGGHKSFIFSVFVVLIVYFFYKRDRLPFLGYGFLGLNVFALIEAVLMGGRSILAAFVQNRVQLTPNQISYFIFDFMQSNELLYLRESILRYFGFESPYEQSIYFILGDKYFNDSFVRANTGACGDAFAQFGYISVFLYTLLIPLAFKVLYAVSSNLDRRILFVVVFLYVSTFINGSFFTVLLTNGFIFITLFLYIISSIKKEES